MEQQSALVPGAPGGSAPVASDAGARALTAGEDGGAPTPVLSRRWVMQTLTGRLPALPFLAFARGYTREKLVGDLTAAIVIGTCALRVCLRACRGACVLCSRSRRRAGGG
jgi:hypothetical protein